MTKLFKDMTEVEEKAFWERGAKIFGRPDSERNFKNWEALPESPPIDEIPDGTSIAIFLKKPKIEKE